MMATAPKISNVVTDLKSEVSKEAEDLVLQTFPKKIEQLNRLLKSDTFNIKDMATIHSDVKACLLPLSNGAEPSTVMDAQQPTAKRRRVSSQREDVKLPATVPTHKMIPSFTTEVPCNAKLEAIVELIKPEIVAVVTSCNKIKVWIQLLIPKIEDGNNFGVSIQEDILSEVSKAESDAGAYLDQFSRYFSTRAKIVCKVAKYPYVVDYHRAVNEYDEKVFFSFRLILSELRNIYAILYDVILKNYEKLKTPRSSNTSSLY